MKTTQHFFFLILLMISSVKGEGPELQSDSCAEFWKRSNVAKSYNFSKYSKVTPQGNLGYSEYALVANRGECIKEWTVLVYMAADNDLSPYAYWDLHEMETQVDAELNLGASSADVDVLVELDTLRKDGIKRMHIFQDDQAYQKQLEKSDFDSKSPKFLKSPIVQVIEEGSSQSAAQRFTEFLKWGVKKYPSKNYMVVVWGHGEGFIGKRLDQSTLEQHDFKRDVVDAESLFFEDDSFFLPAFTDLPDAFIFPLEKPFGGVAFDHSDRSYLTIPDVSKSLKEVQTLLPLGKNIDILAFDACLMQNLEVMAELYTSADFLVGSNQIQNYLGMPYRSILDQINLGVTPVELAKRLPLLTKKSWQKNGYQAQADTKGFETFTMSSLSSWHIREVIIPELQKVSELLLEYLEEESYRKDELLFLIENAPRFQGETIDLGLFYGLVEELLWIERLKGAQTHLSEKLRKMVAVAGQGIAESTLSATFGPLYYDTSLEPEKSYLLGFFKAVSIWLPKSRRLFELRKKEIRRSQLHRGVSAWNRVLEKLYSEELFDLGTF